MTERIVKYDWEKVEQVKACVVMTNIGEHQVRRRYRLDVSLKEKGEEKVALFIMMNPSKADDQVADDTIKKIITYVYQRAKDIKILSEIGKIIFVNLYVVFESKSSNINRLIEKYGMKFTKGIEDGALINNNAVIVKAIEEADIIFAAWGEADIFKYNERIEEIKKLLQYEDVFCIGEPTQNGFPRHLSRIDYNWNIQKNNFN